MKIPNDTTFDNKNPYQVLGVPVGISPVDLRKAYLGLAKTYILISLPPTRRSIAPQPY